MRQATIQLKTRIQNVSIMNNNIEFRKNILNSMVFAFVALALFYILIVGNMIFSIIWRKTLEKEITSLSNEISSLEVSYLAVSGSIDMELSSAMGFRETKAAFATRRSFGFNSSSDTHLENVKLAKNEI